MRCFIHLDVEAISVCKKCGKAMCVECSAYSNHSGICPECRREEFIAERARQTSELASIKSSMIKFGAGAIAIAILAIVLAIVVHFAMLVVLVGSLIFGIKVLLLSNKRKPIQDRIAFLTGEIDKLGLALNKGRGRI